jgi:hypothetical protein
LAQAVGSSAGRDIGAQVVVACTTVAAAVVVVAVATAALGVDTFLAASGVSWVVCIVAAVVAVVVGKIGSPGPRTHDGPPQKTRY